MFPTTVTIHNVADLQKVMSVLYPTTAVVEITDKSRDVTKEVAAAPVEKPAKTAKPTPAATQASPAPTQPTAEVEQAAAPEKTADAASQPVESAAPAPQASTAATASSPSTEVTYKEAAEAVTRLSRTKGRDAAIAVLKSFGADKLPDVKTEDFAAVVAACQAALEG